MKNNFKIQEREIQNYDYYYLLCHRKEIRKIELLFIFRLGRNTEIKKLLFCEFAHYRVIISILFFSRRMPPQICPGLGQRPYCPGGKHCAPADACPPSKMAPLRGDTRCLTWSYLHTWDLAPLSRETCQPCRRVDASRCRACLVVAPFRARVNVA